MTLRDWVRGDWAPEEGRRDAANGALRPPTADDLGYHLSTLFPPVRPRGHLEVRGIDAQPGDGWMVPLAVTAALLDDPVAAEQAMAAAEALWHRPGSPWWLAARHGPARLTSVRPMVFLGGISYSLYLWHVPVIWLVALETERGWMQRPLVLVVSIALAVLSWRVIELPLQRWRRGRAKTPAPTATVIDLRVAPAVVHEDVQHALPAPREVAMLG